MDMNVALILSLVDRMSRPLDQAAQKVTAFGSRVRGAAGAFGQGFAEAVVPQFSGEQFEKNLDRLDRRVERTRNGLLGAFAQATALIAPLVKQADFQDAFIDFANVAEIPIERMGEIEARLIAQTRRTGRNKAELLQILAAYVGKGMDLGDALAAIEATGRAATATRSDVADMTSAGFAAMDNLGVAPIELARAFDIMAASGKEGSFELKDMARNFPSITANAKALGMTGTGAVASLSAALQVAMKSAGSADEAANNAANFMGKITAPETVRNFRKFGVDIEAELKRAAKDGVDPLLASLQLIKKATGGDQFKMGELFGDKQVLDFLRALIPNLEEYERIRDKAEGAEGVIDRDWINVTSGLKAEMQGLVTEIDNLFSASGALLPIAQDLIRWLTDTIRAVNEWTAANPELTATIVKVTAALLAFGVASWVLAFGWALTGRSLFRLIGLFLHFDKAGKNVSAVARALGLLRRAGGGLGWLTRQAARLLATLAPGRLLRAAAALRVLLNVRGGAGLAGRLWRVGEAAATVLSTLGGGRFRRAGAALGGLGRVKGLGSVLRFFSRLGKAALGTLGAVGRLKGLTSAFRGLMALGRGVGLTALFTGLRVAAVGAAGAISALGAPVIAVGAALAAAAFSAWKFKDRIWAFGGGFADGLREALAPDLGWVSQKWSALVAKAGGWAGALKQRFAPAKAAFFRIFDFSGLRGRLSDMKARIGGFFGDLFSREVLSDSDRAGIADSGRRIGRALGNGIKSGFKGLANFGRFLTRGLRYAFSGDWKWPSFRLPKLPSFAEIRARVRGWLDLSALGDWRWPALKLPGLPSFAGLSATVRGWLDLSALGDWTWPALKLPGLPSFAGLSATVRGWLDLSALGDWRWPALKLPDLPSFAGLSATVRGWLDLSTLGDWRWPALKLPDLPSFAGLSATVRGWLDLSALGDWRWPALKLPGLPSFAGLAATVRGWLDLSALGNWKWPPLKLPGLPSFAGLSATVRGWLDLSALGDWTWPALKLPGLPSLAGFSATVRRWFNLSTLGDWTWPALTLPDLPSFAGLSATVHGWFNLSTLGDWTWPALTLPDLPAFAGLSATVRGWLDLSTLGDWRWPALKLPSFDELSGLGGRIIDKLIAGLEQGWSRVTTWFDKRWAELKDRLTFDINWPSWLGGDEPPPAPGAPPEVPADKPAKRDIEMPFGMEPGGTTERRSVPVDEAAAELGELFRNTFKSNHAAAPPPSVVTSPTTAPEPAALPRPGPAPVDHPPAEPSPTVMPEPRPTREAAAPAPLADREPRPASPAALPVAGPVPSPVDHGPAAPRPLPPPPDMDAAAAVLERGGKDAAAAVEAGADKAGRDLAQAGREAGSALGSEAVGALKASAAAIGQAIGNAAAAEIRKATANIRVAVALPNGGGRDIARARAGALHDGVDE